MPDLNELESRLNKVESTLTFMKGGLAVGVVVVLGYFGVTSWYQIPRMVHEAIAEKFGEDAEVTLESALEKADLFLSHEAHNVWPDGSYGIFKYGDCPDGFRKVSGHAKAFSVWERNGTYLQEAKMGDSELKWHKKTHPHADLVLRVCVKDPT